MLFRGFVHSAYGIRITESHFSHTSRLSLHRRRYQRDQYHHNNVEQTPSTVLRVEIGTAGTSAVRTSYGNPVSGR